MASDGWCPFAEQQRSPYFGSGCNGRRAVVLHIAEGGFQSSINFLLEKKLSAHFIISRQGRIVQMVSVNDTAWANGLSYSGGRWTSPEGNNVVPSWKGLIPGSNPNFYTISIEHEGLHTQPWTKAMTDADVSLLQWIAGEFNLVYRPHDTLIGHYEISPVDKPNCPGPNAKFEELAQAANQHDPFPHTSLYTLDSPLLGASQGMAEQVITFIQSRLPAGSEYTNQDVEDIIGFYWEHAVPVGIDPFLAAAQCVFETAALQSYWAARPRRNPAGLGVRQEGGLSFRSWYEAVQAHIGQLLSFALTDAEANDAQRAMILRNPRHANIPDALRGSAKIITGLNHWTDDPDYATKLLARILVIAGA